LSLVILGLITVRLTVIGASYAWHFIRDSGDRPTRLIVADRLAHLADKGATTVAVSAEPAPYALPPMDLWQWQIWLDPTSSRRDYDVTIAAVDHHSTDRANWIRPRLFPTPITWAAKPWDVSVSETFVPREEPD
jgi:hypothetical protein